MERTSLGTSDMPYNTTRDESSENTAYFYNNSYMMSGQDTYVYPGFSFERPIYLYTWETLVIFVSLVNGIVILVLTRKDMRNTTNMILTCIAISDSLTGLVTLPTYIMVYNRFSPAENYGIHGNSQESYILTKELCTSFMLSKLFFSKFFHSVSIFLTLFLGFQRFVSVKYPFKAQAMFTMRNTVIVCVVIFVLSPVLHVYHLVKEKAIEGMCEWRIDDCESDCAFLWIILFVRHLIPCTLLTIFTVLFIRELRRGRLELNREQSRRRAEENRRVSIIVTAIVIVFLVPETPYCLFLLSSVIRKHASLKIDLKANRAIHTGYEIALVLSFHANFYIYTFCNKRFKSMLKAAFLYPVRRAVGKPVRWAQSRSWSSRSGTRRMEGNTSLKPTTDTQLLEIGTFERRRNTKGTEDIKILPENVGLNENTL